MIDGTVFWIVLVITIVSLLLWCVLFHSDNHFVSKEQKGKENYHSSETINSQYWPRWYYSQPYRTGVYAPNLYTRMNKWSPGYYIGSGWQYQLRPGLGIHQDPRFVWNRSQRGYYFMGL